MKRKHSWKARLCGSLLAGSMVLSLLPASMISFAQGEQALTVTWVPQKQTVDAQGSVQLHTSLNTAQVDAPAGAMVEISPTAREAGALDWPDELTIQEADLNKPEDTGDGADSSQGTGDGADRSQDTGGGADSSQDTGDGADSSQDTGDGSVAPASLPRRGEQARLIQKTDGTGAVLRILLTNGSQTYSNTLTFTAAGSDLPVDVTEEDILFRTYDSADDIPAIDAPLLEGSGGRAAVTTSPFTVLLTLPEELTLAASPDTVALDGDGSKDMTFTLTALRPEDGEKTYPFTLTWPEALSRPQGALALSGPGSKGVYTVTNDTEIIAIISAPEDVSVDSLTASSSGLAFDLSLPASGAAGTPGQDTSPYEVAFTVKLDSFTRTQDALNDKVTLSTVNSQGEQVSASVTVTAGEAALPGGEGYTVVAVNTSGMLPQTVGWADGNDEAGKRPTGWSWEAEAGKLVPHLYFTIDGVTRELTEETLAAVGLDSWPTITPSSSGFTVTGLPTQIKEVSAYDERDPVDVTWSLAPPDNVPDGYAFVNVTEENKGQYASVSQTGWYYMLQSQFTFTVEVKKGADKELERKQVEAILSNFAFQWTYTNGGGSDGIMDMVNDPALDTNFAFVGTDDQGNHRNLVTITGLWKYNLDGTPINYRVAELADGTGSSGDGKLDRNELGGSASSLLPDQEEDWLQVLYDNSGVPNHPSDTDAVYDGGKLQLILSGETAFSAEKSWLDENTSQGLASRPEVTFTLWRYQENYSYNTAAQVPGVEMKLNSGTGTEPDYNENGNYYYYPVTFTNPDGSPLTLPKYTADGYAYIYGVKEEMSSGGYEQLYEVVDDETGKTLLPDTLPDGYLGGTRADGDNLLYQDGTLSNRLTGSVQVSATKKWDAAAYQSEFADVAVELTLQSKLKDDSSDDWKDVVSEDGTVKRYLYSFTAERLTESCTAYMPRYDTQGRELEYQWVETAVYQNFQDPGEGQTAEDMLANAQKITISPDGTFTLEQMWTKVNYYTMVDAEGTIVNRIDDSIQYSVEKQWQDPTKKHGIIINLYRYTTSIDLKSAYVSFSFDANGKLTTQTAQDSRITVTQVAAGDWKAVVNNLPRYDESGHPYSYLLLEENDFPEYTTSQDPETGDYKTTVVNGGPGQAIPLLVQKVWLDDGDELHREPVTFTIYNRNTKEPVKKSDGSAYTVTLGGDDSPGLWFQVVKVTADPEPQDQNPNGVYDISDLYVVESQVGNEKVEHYLNGSLSYEDLYQENHGWENGEEHIFDVTTANHRYQVTYAYKATASGDASGVEGTFTVTNRRLGSIDMTVNKTWINGAGDGEDARKLIADELEKLAKSESDGGKDTRLALAFRLVFADESKAGQDGWNISYSGIDGATDTVQVGGADSEKVYIHDNKGNPTSSEQVIIGVKKDNTDATRADTFHFFNLPKYDAQGKVVEYTVEEVWLNVTNANSETPPQLLKEKELEAQYPDLYNLWKEYTAAYETTYVADVGHQANTHDTQTIHWTNTRAYTKTVTWNKEWKDDFAHNNDLRPDIYLDVYQVSHVSDGAGGVEKQIKEVMADLKWTAEQDNSWTVTLSGVQKYDALGYEITYFAVERTVAAVGDYDYQAVKYSLVTTDGSGTEKTTDLGTRDHPASGAVGNGHVLDLLGEEYECVGFDPKDLNIGEYTPGVSGTAPKYPQYALVEGGTFTNTLADSYPIEGMKYWNSLGSWPEERLPGVTFYVHQYSGDAAPKRENLKPEDAIATLTVNNWTLAPMKTGLGYRYLIQYQGENALEVEDGQLVCSGTGDPLPRYDGEGKLYHYLVVEEVNWDTALDTGDRVFTTSYTDFTVKNTYAPTPGSIQVKKHLYLPMGADGKPEAYPAVTFQLTRQVKGTDGTYQDDSFSKTLVLKSDDVKTLYERRQPSDWHGYVTDTLTFTNLPIYAPDGSKYQYTVTEVKTQLQGYDTWAGEGDIADPTDAGLTKDQTAVTGLMPKKAAAVQATFVNKQPVKQEEYLSFTATKIWDDNDNAYRFRPTEDVFKTLLTLKRSAPAQSVPGGGGAPAIREELVQAVLTITGSNTDTWTITIEPADGTSFEKYAPNGMPWRYTFQETTVNNRLQLNAVTPDAPENNVYAPPAGSGGKWPNTINNSKETIPTFGDLTNTTHMNYSFAKEWVDAKGEPITEDYLGFDLTVDFQLQVSADGKQTWHNAAAYFERQKISNVAIGVTGADQGTTDKDTASITGRVDADVWGTKDDPQGAFTKLPTVILVDGTYLLLQYRVIETGVSYGGTTQKVEGLVLDQTSTSTEPYTTTGTYQTVDQTKDGLVKVSTFTRYDNDGVSVSRNRLSTMEVSVEKVWVDGDNQYSTRPGPDAPMTWTSWFVLQRSTNQTSWDNVAVEKLYGGSGSSKTGAGASERWEYTFAGLPAADYAKGGIAYSYRVWELQPKAGGYTPTDPDIEENIVTGGKDHPYNPDGSSYTTKYEQKDSHWTVTNSLDLYVPQVPVTSVRAVKIWAVPAADTASKAEITFQLQYKTETISWRPVSFSNVEQKANSGNGWTVSWTNLPDTIDGEKVTYQVVELPGSGWVKIDEDDQNEEGVHTFTFTNTFTRGFTVEKKWNPTAATTHEVTVWLYRTTDTTKLHTTGGERVPVSETDPDQGFRTAVLKEGNSWQYTFTSLPKYDKDGTLYLYYALEVNDGGQPMEDNKTIAWEDDVYSVTYQTTGGNQTQITNTTVLADLTGTKSWLDGSNEGNTRPPELPLILERKIASDPGWTDVSTLYSPIWDKTTHADENKWVYTYSGLPSRDLNGNVYTYRVREDVPSGYQLKDELTTGQGDVTADSSGHYNFTNLRTGTVCLYVNKTWTGDGESERPSNIDLKVERKLITEDETKWTNITSTVTQPAWTINGNTWSLTYTGLPQFDDQGVRYQYRVTEDGVPTGYEVKNSANTDPNQTYALENIKKGGLTIAKKVTGNAADSDQAFTFTVTLTGISTAGTAEADVDGDYVAVYTRQDGSPENGTVTFAHGVSTTEIALKDKESVTISGLPAGLTYKVTENEANLEGYSTSSTGTQDTIPAGATAKAEFVNHRSSGGTPDNTVDISGTKTWVDQNNAGKTRPSDLELKLYRSVAGGEKVLVHALLQWTSKSGNQWHYTFWDLPKEDGQGNRYLYEVVETVPEGYVSTVSGYNFTNTLVDKDQEHITLTGQKSWVGDTADSRPEEITVVLYDGGGQEVRRVTVTAAQGWRYTFADLPKFDAQGEEISYYVREEPVAGYQVSYSGLDITNAKEESFGGLQVTKRVSGEGAEYDRAFSFTVTLSDTSISGTYGDMTFVDGVASFTLKHGQTAAASGLPAGTAYTVTEADAEGYTTSASNAQGTISQTALAAVTFLNTAEEPEQPDDPEEPDDPDGPDDPNIPDDPQGPDVPTGDRGRLSLYGALTALFACGLAGCVYLGWVKPKKKGGKRLSR